MTKSELTRAISERTGLTLRDSAVALDAALETIAGELADNGKVQLTGFGSFIVKERAAHMGRNLATGEPVEVPAFRTVQFKVGKLLKERVNGAPSEDAAEEE